MTSEIVLADWIKRVADEERRRDAARLSLQEEAARKADDVRVHASRLVDGLNAAIVRDVESFRQEFLNDRSRDILLNTRHAENGFVVSRPASPSVSLTVDPHLNAGKMTCHYRFTTPNGLPPREHRFDILFVGEGETLEMKHRDTGHVYATADALSEFLLVPVFTGRPR
jgi:hypothetical protein